MIPPVMPISDQAMLLPRVVETTPEDKLLLLHLEYQLIQLGEERQHVRKIITLFDQTRAIAFDTEDEWRDFIRTWDVGLDQDSHYNAILDIVCTADLGKKGAIAVA